QAWGALLNELREAVFEIAEPAVASAKRGWWAEELQAIASGTARHPLGQALALNPASRSAPWAGLGLALYGAGGEQRADDTARSLAALLPLAEAVIAVENAVFHSRGDADAVRSLALHWLLQRLPAGLTEADGARIPMHLLARHAMTAAQLPGAPAALLRDWAAALLAASPASAPGAAFLRRARSAFDRARLRRLARLGGEGGFDEPAAPPTLWRAWRAARGA
ncbi:MAG: hypothetical protein ABI588_10700, partial [Arenimonas sp.]